MRNLLVLTVLTLSLTASGPSKAVVSLATGPASAAAAYGINLVMMGLISNLISTKAPVSNTTAKVTKVLAKISFFTGLLLLESEQNVIFTRINPEEASELGISDEDRLIYNSEIDGANAMSAHVQTALASLENPTAEDSKKAWDLLSNSVSPETFKTMQTLASQLNN